MEKTIKKIEDEFTKKGWIRIDQGLPGFCDYVKVLGYTLDNPEVIHEDEATIARVNNKYMFLTEEWISEIFIVTHWKKLEKTPTKKEKIPLALSTQTIITYLQNKLFEIEDMFIQYDIKENNQTIYESEEMILKLIPNIDKYNEYIQNEMNKR